MAQRTEKEDSEFINKLVPEPLPLCVNSCLNPTAASTSLNTSISSRSALSAPAEDDRTRSEMISVASSMDADVTVVMKRREVNRCAGCRRKVGLTGFRCRCGEVFCGEHRYSDRHGCGYDYKAAGREAIERENPVFKAAKILRI